MKFKKIHILALGLLASGTAIAFPWDIDLVDSKFFRGYEWRMMTPAEGSISQEQASPLTGVEYNFTADMTQLKSGQNINVVSSSPEAAPQFIKLPNPNVQTEQANVYTAGQKDAQDFYASIQYKKNSDTRPYMVQQGEFLAKTYCKACHIVEKGAEKSPVAWGNEYNSRGNPVSRWTLPGGIELAGSNSTLNTPNYKGNDVALYDVIRNGKGQMPAYGHAMYDHEIWAAISYLRSVSN